MPGYRAQDYLAAAVLTYHKPSSLQRERCRLSPAHANQLLVKRLKEESRDGLALAKRLDSCSFREPCCSGACCHCVGRIQTWFAEAAIQALKAKGSPC